MIVIIFFKISIRKDFLDTGFFSRLKLEFLLNFLEQKLFLSFRACSSKDAKHKKDTKMQNVIFHVLNFCGLLLFYRE